MPIDQCRIIDDVHVRRCACDCAQGIVELVDDRSLAIGRFRIENAELAPTRLRDIVYQQRRRRACTKRSDQGAHLFLEPARNVREVVLLDFHIAAKCRRDPVSPLDSQNHHVGRPCIKRAARIQQLLPKRSESCPVDLYSHAPEQPERHQRILDEFDRKGGQQGNLQLLQAGARGRCRVERIPQEAMGTASWLLFE